MNQVMNRDMNIPTLELTHSTLGRRLSTQTSRCCPDGTLRGHPLPFRREIFVSQAVIFDGEQREDAGFVSIPTWRVNAGRFAKQ